MVHIPSRTRVTAVHHSWQVAIVSTQSGWRGGEEQARQLAIGLRSRNHACTIIALPTGEFARRMAGEGFRVETYGGNGQSLRSIQDIRRHLKRLRPDCVHANDSRALTAAGIASWGLCIPLRVASRRVDFPLRSAWKYRLFCDRVVCVSHAVARICSQCGIAESQLRVVHSGVDPQRMATGDRHRGRRSLGLNEGEHLLLSVAALTEHKGHEVLLAALPAVIQSVGNVVVAIAGDGELRQRLQRQAEVLGVARYVRLLGYRSDIPDLMAACDVFVMPSLEEGLGTTVIDAMNAGCPIVATTAGGIPELLIDPATSSAAPASFVSSPLAWTIPPADAPALAAALVEALGSPAESQARASRARERARRCFTAEAMVEGMLRVYGEALDRKSLKRAA